MDEAGCLAKKGIFADKVLELVGPKTLKDSLKLLKPGGICCHTGILGGLESMSGFDPIKDVPNGRYLTGFFSNYPTQEDMSSIYTFVVEHGIKPIVARAFPFDQLPDAIAYQDAGGFQGKIVVTPGTELA